MASADTTVQMVFMATYNSAGNVMIHVLNVYLQHIVRNVNQNTYFTIKHALINVLDKHFSSTSHAMIVDLIVWFAPITHIAILVNLDFTTLVLHASNNAHLRII